MLRSCESAKPVSDYIDERLDDALNNVFITDAAKQESVKLFLRLSNSENIAAETKYKYSFGAAELRFLFPILMILNGSLLLKLT